MNGRLTAIIDNGAAAKIPASLVALLTYAVMAGYFTQSGVILGPAAAFLGRSLTDTEPMFSYLLGGNLVGIIVSLVSLHCLHCDAVTPSSNRARYGAEPPLLIGAITGARFTPYSAVDEAQGHIGRELHAKISHLAELHSIDLETPFAAGAGRSMPFGCLFSDRQLLLLLTYVDAIKSARRDMLDRGIAAERIVALMTYLAFFLGDTVDQSSKASNWNNRIHRIERASRRLQITPTRGTFVELTTSNLVEHWLARIVPSIRAMEGTRGVRRIELANATTLPWLDESVDAIVTDPPYYDSIPYTDISSFYWTWERAILGTDSIDLATPAESLEVADGTDGYEAQLGRALEEFHRVLKQGRTLCLFLTTRTDTALARYVDLSQTAGFEFFISYRVNDYERGSLVRDNPKTYLLLLRKPFALSFAAPAAVETRRVIEVGTTLYAGLAEKLLQVLGDDVAELLPQNARGARVEVLMEVLAEGDVRALLRQALGLAGIRQLAAAIPLPVTGEPPETVLNAILEYFGFAIPGPIPGGGPSQVARDLRLAIVGLKNTRDFDRVTSEVLRVARSVESLLHRTVFSWTHLIFGERRDIVLSEILRAARADVTLDRLSFGHVLRLWRELPQRISEEQLSDEIQAKFGGRYPYELRSDAKPIEQLVTIRNDVAHHKVAASGSDFEKWHSKALAVCERVQEGLTVLVERRALIRIAVPMSISAPSETTVCSVFGAC